VYPAVRVLTTVEYDACVGNGASRRSIGSANAEYDRFADIYAAWTDSATSTGGNLRFYVDTYLAADCPVVELGIGDGRIAVEAARRGCLVTGVDVSGAMLERCRTRAERAGVTDRLTLVQADFRDFNLAKPAALVALPYHSIGHLTTLDEKRAAVGHVFNQLRPGGRFIFDDFFMTSALMAHMRQVQLRAAYQTPERADCLLWVTSLVDEAKQTISVVTWEDILGEHGRLEQRHYRRLSLSWLEPTQARDLLTGAGFSVETCFGDFNRTSFDPESAVEQIWIARKPDRGK